MTPHELAQLHSAAFEQTRAWSADEFERLLASKGVILISTPSGFALTRDIGDESELLTLAVTPSKQNKGIGRALLHRWIALTPATHAFLEVASDNAAALHLYLSEGFAEVGRRTAYYKRRAAPPVDAIVLQKSLRAGSKG